MVEFEKLYCCDCKWEWHEFGCRKTPQCSHTSNRAIQRNYAYRMTKADLYPFCANINTYGSCDYWSAKSVGRNIFEIWRAFRNRRRRQ